MTLTMDLDLDTARRLRASAHEIGTDEASLARALLADALRSRDGMIDAEFAGEDWEAIREALERSDSDFAAGRYKTIEQIRADKRKRFGV